MPEDRPRRLIAGRGFSLEYKGKVLLSRVDPIGRSEAAAEKTVFLPNSLYFCPSPLFGYGIARLLSLIDSSSAIVAVEADAALKCFTSPEVFDDTRFAFIFSAEPEAVCAFVQRRFGQRRFRRVIEVRLNSGWRLSEELYASMAALLEAELNREWSNALTLTKLGRRYALNAARNIAAASLSHPLVKGAWKNEALIALGAGPSLDSCAAELSKNQANRPYYKLICVDTALTALLSRGLKPDLVVALESQFWNMSDFVGTGKTTPLLRDLSSYPATSELGDNASFFHVRWAELRFLDRLRAAGLLPPERPALGSVGLSLIDIARYLSAGLIGLAGLDFAYTVDSYHAAGTPSDLLRRRDSTRVKPLINPHTAFRAGSEALDFNGGRLWRTDPALRRYAALFRREFDNDERLYRLFGGAIDLGIRDIRLSRFLEMAAQNQTSEKPRNRESDTLQESERIKRTLNFIDAELSALSDLRELLSGESADREKTEDRKALFLSALEKRVDDLDYLWAHFPECAGRGTRPKMTDESFAKRVRVEIEPFIKAFQLARNELIRHCF